MNFCFAVFVRAVYLLSMKAMDLFLAKIFLFAFSYPKTLAVLCLLAFVLLVCAAAAAFKAKRTAETGKGDALVAREALETQSDGFYLWRYNAIGFLQSAVCSRRLRLC